MFAEYSERNPAEAFLLRSGSDRWVGSHSAFASYRLGAGQ